MVGLGSQQDWLENHESWERIRRGAEELKTYHLRCNIFQARDLPDADLGGGIDPYFKVNYWKQKELSLLWKTMIHLFTRF